MYNRLDYITLGDFFGVTVDITYNTQISPFDITILITEPQEPGRWPWTWPHTWSAGEDLFDLLECLYYKSTPAYIKLQVLRKDLSLIWVDENGDPWTNEFGENWTDVPP